MGFKTYSEIKGFVEKKLDLLEEAFITSAEMLEYCEEAIKFCEAEIHKLNIEDQYFTAQSTIALVSGKADYELPSNMYAQKIQRMVYSSGSDVYPIKRLTKQHRFEESELLKQHSSNSRSWDYMLINNDPRTGTRMRIFPAPSEVSSVFSVTGNPINGSAVIGTMSSTTGIAAGYFVSGTSIPDGTRVLSVDSATQVTLDSGAISTAITQALTFTEPKVLLWYIRKAKIPTGLTDLIDFPEFWPFIAQHMIVECLKKELGNSRVIIEESKLLTLKEQVLSTLSNMVPDQEDYIEKDTSHYDDMGHLGDFGD